MREEHGHTGYRHWQCMLVNRSSDGRCRVSDTTRTAGIKGNCDNAKIPGMANTTTTRPTTLILHSVYSSLIRLNLLPYYILSRPKRCASGSHFPKVVTAAYDVCRAAHVKSFNSLKRTDRTDVILWFCSKSSQPRRSMICGRIFRAKLPDIKTSLHQLESSQILGNSSCSSP